MDDDDVLAGLPRAAREGFVAILNEAEWLAYLPPVPGNPHARQSMPAQGLFLLAGEYPYSPGIYFTVACQYPPWLPEEDLERASREEAHTEDHDVPGWQLMVQLPTPPGAPMPQVRVPGNVTATMTTLRVGDTALWVPSEAERAEGTMWARSARAVICRLQQYMSAFHGLEDHEFRDAEYDMYAAAASSEEETVPMALDDMDLEMED